MVCAFLHGHGICDGLQPAADAENAGDVVAVAAAAGGGGGGDEEDEEVL